MRSRMSERIEININIYIKNFSQDLRIKFAQTFT